MAEKKIIKTAEEIAETEQLQKALEEQAEEQAKKPVAEVTENEGIEKVEEQNVAPTYPYQQIVPLQKEDFERHLTMEYVDPYGKLQFCKYRVKAELSTLIGIVQLVKSTVFSFENGYAPYIRDISFYYGILDAYTDLDTTMFTPDVMYGYLNNSTLLTELLRHIDAVQLATLAAWCDDVIQHEKEKGGFAQIADWVRSMAQNTNADELEHFVETGELPNNVVPLRTAVTTAAAETPEK